METTYLLDQEIHLCFFIHIMIYNCDWHDMRNFSAFASFPWGKLYICTVLIMHLFFG